MNKKPPNPAATCLNTAIRLLARRDYTQHELKQKLTEKNYPPAAVADTLHQLTNLGYLNDEKYAAGRIKYGREISRWGKKRILQELQQKGVSDTIIQQALAHFFNNQPEENYWLNQALQLLQRRFGAAVTHSANPNDVSSIQKQQNKYLRFLLYRGFSPSQALQALHIFLQQHKN